MLAEQGGSVTDGELLKLGLTAAADKIYPEKMNSFATVRFEGRREREEASQ